VRKNVTCECARLAKTVDNPSLLAFLFLVLNGVKVPYDPLPDGL